MIDIENKVFTEIATATRAQFSAAYPTLKVYGEYIFRSEAFPTVTLEEVENTVHKGSMTSQVIENRANVVYECNVYANDSDKKQTAKKIADFIDSKMSELGFVRSMKSPMPNYDETVYRITLRWSATISDKSYSGDPDNHLIYRR